MTAPTAKAVDPAAAASGSAEDSATGFDLALFPDTTTTTAYHQGVVDAYIDSGNQAQHVSEAFPLPVIDSHPNAGRSDVAFTTGAVAVIAGDYLGAFETVDLADSYGLIHSLTLSWSTALWPADAEVDLYIYDCAAADTGWSGAVGDPFTAPVPDPADGSLQGKVRLTNDCVGTAFAVTTIANFGAHSATGSGTIIAVYAAGTGFTTATPLTLNITAEVQP